MMNFKITKDDDYKYNEIIINFNFAVSSHILNNIFSNHVLKIREQIRIPAKYHPLISV